MLEELLLGPVLLALPPRHPDVGLGGGEVTGVWEEEKEEFGVENLDGWDISLNYILFNMFRVKLNYLTS